MSSQQVISLCSSSDEDEENEQNDGGIKIGATFSLRSIENTLVVNENGNGNDNKENGNFTQSDEDDDIQVIM